MLKITHESKAEQEVYNMIKRINSTDVYSFKNKLHNCYNDAFKFCEENGYDCEKIWEAAMRRYNND